MSATHHRGFFGRPHLATTITIAKGERVRQLTLRPWLLLASSTLAGCALAGIVACGLPGTLAFGGAAIPAATDPAPLARDYELRIAALRSEVERLTTRGFIDQAKVTSKVDVLLSQQADLAERYAKLGPLLERARSNGLLKTGIPVPQDRPSLASDPSAAPPALAFTEEAAKTDGLARFRLIDRSEPAGTEPSRSEAPTPDLIQAIGRSLDEAELRQIDGLEALAADARGRSDAIGAVLRTEGIEARGASRSLATGEGGPFVPVPAGHDFDTSLARLASALDALQAARETSRLLPLAAPVTSQTISSGFGIRSDPFLGREAMHTGVDFVAEPGTPVAATAPGKVVFAGDNGSYGNMVEIDHGNGLATRYAHLSRILVTVGDKVTVGMPVGQVGSTGRSTGAHLHYELRRAGDAIDPERYLRAGRRISALG
ncbi:membrane protein [Aureimonas endophytica]|uniref:Membrane protein n=1 Tax=Aureimonas endophytica TaxID=2027858 RepID=A0A916ZDQ8_9HYPH|nr:M23 family metallopeptidase [Aureimonas endophytica]GGD88581.1 membrane protein [Aureimonas endophytica]